MSINNKLNLRRADIGKQLYKLIMRYMYRYKDTDADILYFIQSLYAIYHIFTTFRLCVSAYQINTIQQFLEWIK